MNTPFSDAMRCSFLIALMAMASPAATNFTSFTPGQTWLADDGRHINCHGGGILFEGGTYYWFGESRNGRGVACYTSTDLYNWRNRGLVFTPDANIADIRPGCIMERPKVIKCPSTGAYALWFHLEFAGEGYNTARVAVCSSNTVLGPYTFVRSFRPSNNMSRDQTVFVDDNGTGYHVYSSRDNYDLRVHSLTNDFLNTSGQDTMIFESGAHREAPAIFKHGTTYYLITSGATGWAPNAARYDVSTYIYKRPWTRKTNPCTGSGADSTFGGQSTFVFKVPGYTNAYIFMADRWITSNLANSTHLWLPITILANGDIQIPWRSLWDLSVFGPPVSVLEREVLVVRAPSYRPSHSRMFDLCGRVIPAFAASPSQNTAGIKIRQTTRKSDLSMQSTYTIFQSTR